MYVNTWVRQHVNRLDGGTIFTTRDLLGYGSRNSIDKSTCNLIKEGEIRRLARGVFIKDGVAPKRKVQPIEVAFAKAKAWGKQIFESTISDPRFMFGQPNVLQRGSDEAALEFRTSGRTSSFLLVSGQRIIFRGQGPRKLSLPDSTVGQVARELWEAGRESARQVLRNALAVFKVTEKNELLAQFRLLPGWLNAIFGEFIRDVRSYLPPAKPDPLPPVELGPPPQQVLDRLKAMQELSRYSKETYEQMLREGKIKQMEPLRLEFDW
jgi:hypothetical protein